MITKIVLYVSAHTCTLSKLQKPQAAQARCPDSEDHERQRLITAFIHLFSKNLFNINCVLSIVLGHMIPMINNIIKAFIG